MFGRLVFGGSAVLFGIIALMWRDADTWQSLASVWRLPLGTAVGSCLMAALIAGGMALLYAGTARVASVVLGIVYALFSLACLPGIIAAPKIFGEYDGFFEQFSLLCGAIAVFAATQSTVAPAVRLGRIARLGLGTCTVSFTLAQMVYLRFTASLVPNWILPNQMFWAILTTIAFALAAIAMLVNRQAALAMRLMTLMLGLFGVLVWIPRLITYPQAHGNWSEFVLTGLITGAAWVIADLTSLLRRSNPKREQHDSSGHPAFGSCSPAGPAA